ncbi:MAG: hypothetical protein ACFFDW_03955 [Candidatus Thorarchaeota archaeon]
MISTAVTAETSLIHFDEFRSNLAQISTKIDEIIKNLKKKDDSGNSNAKTFLYFYEGLFLIVEGEKKYRNNDFSGASLDFTEGGKAITRFLRLAATFPEAFRLEADRLERFSKGKSSECLALKHGTKIENQIDYLEKAMNAYISEIEIANTQQNPLLSYNSKARENFVLGLIYKYKADSEFNNKNLRAAKSENLKAYRYFVKAAYFNPSYSKWVTEQNNAIKRVILLLVENQASALWKDAYSLSNEGKFTECERKCYFASKLFLRASNLASDMKTAKQFYSYSFILKASMYEAKANEFTKNLHDVKSSIRQFELASNSLKQAVESYPIKDEQDSTIKRLKAQQQYYLGQHYLSQGIYNLDSEKYQEAIELFTQAENSFNKAMELAEIAEEKRLINLIEKSIAEAKGYIGMCKTVLD